MQFYRHRHQPNPSAASAILLTLLGACAGAAVDVPGAGGSGGDAPGTGGSTTDVEPTDPAFVPQRLRRLSNFEYDRSVASLLGVADRPARTFAPDLRQRHFTTNASQRVDAVLASQLDAAAVALAAKVREQLAGSCTGAERSCAEAFIKDFVPKAYRRPIGSEETSDLLKVYDVGAEDGGLAGGIELVVSAVLQSASFLYLVELGEGTPKDGSVMLSQHELAAALSYLITGGPPDETLRTLAQQNKLGDRSTRRQQAERLFAQMDSRAQMQRLIKEWLDLDRLEERGKDDQTYPRFAELRPQMIQEADDFIAEVLYEDDASLHKLIAADYTVAENALATFYGAAASDKRVSLAGVRRRGIINQAGFLAVHGNDTESSPVKRGVSVLKKLMCLEFPSPTELNIAVVPPPADRNATTRQRFDQHGKDPACAGCHRTIDAVGFTFEGFDGMGGSRTQENGKQVDTSSTLVDVGSIDGPIKDSAELAEKIAQSPELAECFALNFFRFASAQSAEGTEKKFLELYASFDEQVRGNIKQVMFSFVQSDVFSRRRVR